MPLLTIHAHMIESALIELYSGIWPHHVIVVSQQSLSQATATATKATIILLLSNIGTVSLSNRPAAMTPYLHSHCYLLKGRHKK